MAISEKTCIFVSEIQCYYRFLLLQPNMKRFFYTLPLLVPGMLITSCQDENFGISEDLVHATAVDREFEQIFGTVDPAQDWDLYGQMQKQGLTRAITTDDGYTIERAYIFCEDLMKGTKVDFDYNDVVLAVSTKVNVGKDEYYLCVDPVCVSSGRYHWLGIYASNGGGINWTYRDNTELDDNELHKWMTPSHAKYYDHASAAYPSDVASSRKQNILNYYADKLNDAELTDLADMIDNGGAATVFLNMELPNSGCLIDMKKYFRATKNRRPDMNDIADYAQRGELLHMLFTAGACRDGGESLWPATNFGGAFKISSYSDPERKKDYDRIEYTPGMYISAEQPYLGTQRCPRLIMVPPYIENPNGGILYFEWPKENVCLNEAYPQVKDWCQNALSGEWFSCKIEGKVTEQPARYVDLLKFMGL